MYSHLPPNTPLAATPQGPNAEEIAAELEKRLSAHWPPGSESPAVAPDKPPVVTKPSVGPAPAAPPNAVIVVQPCRGERLNECTNEQLLDWGKPPVEEIEGIHNQQTADNKKLDDITGGKMDWVRELAGTGGDKDSKWLKGYELANRTATGKFRDCCAERVIAYHKELLQRDHSGSENAELYEWVENLLQPEGSKQWKAAREGGSKVGGVYFDLNFFQIDLNYLVSVQRIAH